MQTTHDVVRKGLRSGVLKVSCRYGRISCASAREDDPCGWVEAQSILGNALGILSVVPVFENDLGYLFIYSLSYSFFFF